MKKIIFKQLALFLTALSFLSRLSCARFLNLLLDSSEKKIPENQLEVSANQENLTDQSEAPITQNLQKQVQQAQINLGKSVVYFPLIGMFLAGLAILPIWAGLGGNNFWLQSWLYVLLLAWLSRGLHWDGLADLADACASFSQGEKFWKIIKDSSLGALGALVLFFSLVGYIIAVQGLILKGQWLSLIWAAAMGRLGCLGLAAVSSPYSKASLAKIFEYAKPLPWAIFWMLILLGVGGFFISWKACGLAFIFGAGIVFYLSRVAKKQGGYNGDFLGATIVLVELFTLLAVC